jgi:hypothetical protein
MTFDYAVIRLVHTGAAALSVAVTKSPLGILARL